MTNNLKGKKLYEALSIKLGTQPLPITFAQLAKPRYKADADPKYAQYIPEEGQYSLVLGMSGDEGQKTLADMEAADERCEAVIKEWAKANGKAVHGHRPFSLKETEKGQTLSLNMKAGYIDKNTRELKPIKPNITDAEGNPVSDEDLKRLSSGSIVRVGIELYPYLVAGMGGMSKKVRLIQVLEIKEFTPQAKADDFFGEAVPSSFKASSDSSAVEEDTEPTDDEAYDF